MAFTPPRPRSRALRLALAAALLAACSSTAHQNAPGSGGAGATGGAGGSGATDAGADTSIFVDGGPPPRPFWCSDYQTGNAATPPGWVTIGAVVKNRGTGTMTSPISLSGCQVGASDWSVSASGTEADGVDETTMSFQINGSYQGPGRYAGTLARGISASFSHDDLGPIVFTSVPSSDCELCVNDDGLSGTVNCWGLETPAGSDLEVAYIQAGNFTCPNAQPKPADAPTDPPISLGLYGPQVLCHYLDRLGCSGRPPDATTCLAHSNDLTLNGPCAPEWNIWLGCFEHQRPSQFRCDTGGDLVSVASGACSTELAALKACRAAPSGAGGAGGGGAGGTSGAGGSTGLTGLQASPECAAFCAMVTSKCGFACTPVADCIQYAGECEAGARDMLACAVTGDHLFCGTNNWIILDCTYHDALCVDGGTRG